MDTFLVIAFIFVVLYFYRQYELKQNEINWKKKTIKEEELEIGSRKKRKNKYTKSEDEEEEYWKEYEQRLKLERLEKEGKRKKND
jgi:hypothetical protein